MNRETSTKHLGHYEVSAAAPARTAVQAGFRPTVGVGIATPLLGFTLLFAIAWPPTATRGQDAPSAEIGAPLAEEQLRLAERFKRFEELLLRIAEVSAEEDPERAELLRRAVAESKQRLLSGRFRDLVQLLNQNRLLEALAGQKQLRAQLQELLDILMRDENAARHEREQERLKAQIRELGRLIKLERGLQADTESGKEATELSERQAQLAEQAGKLEQSFDEPAENRNDGGSAEAAQDANSEGEPPPSTGEPPGAEPPADQPPAGGEAKDDSTPPDEVPRSGDLTQPPPKPGLDALREAHERMEQAHRKLAEAERQGAVKEQEQAVAELEKARAELERVLRQAREEEIVDTLRRLEERFREMLEAQRKIAAQTERLGAIPLDQRAGAERIEAGRLGRAQDQLANQAQDTHALLVDDGTAVALPEAVAQLESDMRLAAARLAAADVGAATQEIETDLVFALEELLAAVERAMEEQANPQEQAEGQPAEPGEEKLVEPLAELKMIRSLQWRVNRRTEQLRLALDTGEASEPIRAMLVELARRQQRIYRITRDIVNGKSE